MINTILRSRRTRLLASASSAILCAVVTTGGVSAQTTEEGDVILVTGSRIARSDLQASSPVSLVDQDQIRLSGEVNVENILEEIPAVAPDLGGTTNNGGSGIATVDLRALGANRTLVLVNGRRYVASDNQQRVDLNNIPAALIDRVEVVTGGASSIYGSDAVAGAVNFILKDDFEGVRLGGQWGRTDDSDGDTANLNLTMGTNTADGRGNITVFADYLYRDAVLAGARDWADSAYDDLGGGTVLDPLGSSRIPGSQILQPGQVLADGSTAGSVGFLEDGTPYANPASFNFQPTNFIQTPAERFLITGLGRYEVGEYAEVYMETMYSNTSSDQQLAFDANDIPDNPAALLVPVTDNPLITNQELIDYLLTNFDSGALGDTAGDGIATIPDLRRRMVEAGPRFTNFELDAVRIATGVRGDLPDFDFGSNWNYDLFYSYAKTNRAETLRAYTSDARIQQAVNVVNTPTGPACADPTGGCVPITLFGPDSIDPAGVSFIAPAAAVARETEQQIIAANIGGNIAELPAGPVGVAFGAEWRDEQAETNPDQFVISGELGPGTNESPVKGGFDVWEIYGETLIPIVADQPLVHRLEIEGAVRYADYSSVGSAVAYKAGGTWELTPDFKIRGLYQEAVRAPNVFELFGQATGAATVTDPCAAAQTASDPGARTFCGVLGVPDPSTFVPDAQATTRSTGAILAGTDLDAETAKTWTVGFVWEPDMIEGLSMTADYYSISVEDAIATLGPTLRAQQCLDTRDTASPECSLLTRSPSGDIAFVQDSFLNTGAEERVGVDWQVGYDRDLAFANLPGEISIFHTGNYTFTNESIPAEGQNPIDCNGIFSGNCTGLGDFNQPKWRMTNNIGYSYGPLNLRTQVRVIGSLENGAAGQISDLAFPDTPVTAYVDITADYQISERVNVYAGVDNLADLDPPRMGFGFTGRNGGSDAGTDPSLYDVLGRRFFVGAVVEF